MHLYNHFRKKMNHTKREEKELFTLTIFLCVCVIASISVLAHYLSNFVSYNREEIALVPSKTETSLSRVDTDNNTNTSTASNIFSTSTSSRTEGNPKLEVYDEKTVWSTKTQVDIFSASYKNNQGISIVESEKNDKVIAPGIGDSYTFWLKNTGDMPVDYTLEFETLFSPENVKIPVKAKIKSYDGNWLLGGKDKWGDIQKLNTVEDRATLGVNQYVKYTLDWKWIFEREYDWYDTYLGNRAVNEDLSLTIIIKTVAEVHTGTSMADNTSDGDSSIQPTQPDISNPVSSTKKDDDISSIPFIIADQIPKTGDIRDLTFYIILVFASILGISMILYNRKKDREREK